MEDELKQFLHNDRAPDRRGWRCANEAELAAYADGRLDAKARLSVEKHLAGCKPCIEQVSFLVHSSEWPDSPDVPTPILARAKNLVSETRQPSIAFGWRWATAALAALLVVTGLIALANRWRSPESATANQQPSVEQPEQKPAVVSPESSRPNPDVVAMASPDVTAKSNSRKAEPSVPTIRKAESENHLPQLLLPGDGAVLKLGATEFKWQKVPEAISYEVSILTAAGETVITRETDSTSLKIGSDARLTPGSKYFVSVRAQLRDGKTLRSSPVSFRVSN